jgi:hypothetical protein
MKRILELITRLWRSREVKVSKAVQSPTVSLLIKVVKEGMMRGDLERKILLLRLFATLVVRKAIRVMLVLKRWNGVSVVVRRDILLRNVSMMMWCVLIAMKKDTWVHNARNLRRLRLVGKSLLYLVLRQRMRIIWSEVNFRGRKFFMLGRVVTPTLIFNYFFY